MPGSCSSSSSSATAASASPKLLPSPPPRPLPVAGAGTAASDQASAAVPGSMVPLRCQKVPEVSMLSRDWMMDSRSAALCSGLIMPAMAARITPR
ncbi:hypothetical protein TSOC_012777 [Tetrabaena socialis]|uniref:Uncharacterized protein n=1 Tax=Tetrabaena socialis TaxID=47790 RepID=A0A2J7ZM76_9CHLO|nr:hypothetical protein TSOC_012777 [Tetrabaena socialis]|eukprot:PNH01350.1 hypothetical protein TSOC_012777 [Tetrabaena socialis]